MKQKTYSSSRILVIATVLAFVSPLAFVGAASATPPCGKAATQQGPTDDRRTTEEIRRIAIVAY